uniref:ATPase subuint 8 n=1 Tax=Hygrobates taniguchii TaxID=2759127 RepID=A0A6J4EE01_9ACAR|nr:ATPase subuint 8 [Hygrobates taniguchii]
MPQMSPMNWIIISTSFFLMLNLISSLFNKMTVNQKVKKATTKNMYWKW